MSPVPVQIYDSMHLSGQADRACFRTACQELLYKVRCFVKNHIHVLDPFPFMLRFYKASILHCPGFKHLPFRHIQDHTADGGRSDIDSYCFHSDPNLFFNSSRNIFNLHLIENYSEIIFAADAVFLSSGRCC